MTDEVKAAAERLLCGPRAYRDGAHSQQGDLQNVADDYLSLAAVEAEQSYVLRVLSLVDAFDCDDVLWHVNDGRVRFHVRCSDLFYWACADCEEITPENVSEFERSYADVKAVTTEGLWQSHAQSLFACRVRNMRPQGACYKTCPEKLWPLFDAAGPERNPGDTPRPKMSNADSEWSQRHRIKAYWETKVSEVEAENERLRVALEELFALVMGECRSLLDEDSGGSARLYLQIEEALGKSQ
jgi:hypothetical protein